MNEHDSDFVDEIVPSELPQHTSPPRDDFKPWHKVRKQFIRERQWNELVRRVVDRYLRQQLQHEPVDWSLDQDEDDTVNQMTEIPESVRVERSLNCLVIPGDDLLDVRSLWSYIRSYKCFIRYLGFNEAQGSDQRGTRVHVSNNEVTSLDRVARDSRVIPDRFQSIASQNSQAYRYLKEHGPFHIVNLDLCDSLFPTRVAEPNDYYKAVHRLAEYQMKTQTSPWLLFVTTQVEPAVVNGPELERMCKPIRTNWDTHPEFALRLGAVIPNAAFEVDGVTINISELDEERMIFVFGVALGKWLMALATSASPQWFLQMLRSYRYAVRRGPFADMLSLAFLFRPKFSPPVDATGLSDLQIAVPHFPSEVECALKLVSAMQNIADVDALLQDDTDLRALMETASADLLESAGFDRGKYLQWPDRYYE